MTIARDCQTQVTWPGIKPRISWSWGRVTIATPREARFSGAGFSEMELDHWLEISWQTSTVYINTTLETIAITESIPENDVWDFSQYLDQVEDDVQVLYYPFINLIPFAKDSYHKNIIYAFCSLPKRIQTSPRWLLSESKTAIHQSLGWGLSPESPWCRAHTRPEGVDSLDWVANSNHESSFD